MSKLADSFIMFDRFGIKVKPLYRIGKEIIECKRVDNGEVKRYSIHDLHTPQNILELEKVHSNLPDIEMKTRLSEKYLRKKYNRKRVKALAIKLSFIVQQKIDQLKCLEAKDLWKCIPQAFDFSSFKKRDIRKVVRAMNILERYNMQSNVVLRDAKNELELRRKSDAEKESERARIREVKDKWRERAIEVHKEMVLAKANYLPVIQRFVNEIWNDVYERYNKEECHKIAIKLLDEVQERQPKPKRRKEKELEKNG